MSLAADIKPSDILTLQVGVVTDNADPEGLYRVKLMIPGLLEPESDWAPPLGTSGGGSAQRGGMVPLAIGATVGVLFHNGDPEAPYYLCGWPGITDAGSEMPDPAKAAGADAHRVAALQVGNFSFAVDERDDKLVFSVLGKSTTSGAPGIELQLDFKRKRITLSAVAAIILQTPGLIYLNGTSVRLRDRMLGVSSKPV